jgi:hypothetical protein
MVNFDVPVSIGIGLARGPATRLESEGKILDYSGNTLNLGARLMDLARPKGIVVDSSVGKKLLERAVGKAFLETDVYLQGVAETEPVTVYYDAKFTQIPEVNRHPFNMKLVTETHDTSLKRTRRVFKKGMTQFRFPLDNVPAYPERIKLEVHLRDKSPGKERYFITFRHFKYRYGTFTTSVEPLIEVDVEKLLDRLAKFEEITQSTVTLVITYHISMTQLGKAKTRR